MPDRKSPSLYEILTGNFTGDLPLEVVNEEDQVILSVLDNIQGILNTRTETISHRPDYVTKILQGMPGTAHELIDTLAGNQQLQQLEMAAEQAQALKADVDSQIQMFEQRLNPLNKAVIFSAPEGMALTSGEDMQLAAARNVTVNAGGDISAGTTGNLTALAGEKLGLFARTGQLSLKASEGPVEVQAQNANMRLFAEKKLTVSSASDITFAGKKRITLIGGGSYLRLEAGKIEYATKAMYLRRVKRTMAAGPASLPLNLPLMPLADLFNSRISDQSTTVYLDQKKTNLKPLLRIADTPGINGIAQSDCKWQIVLADSYMQAVTTDEILMNGQSDAKGKVLQSEAQQIQLMELTTQYANQLWLVVGHRAHRLYFNVISEASHEDVKDYCAQDTMGFHRAFNNISRQIIPGEQFKQCISDTGHGYSDLDGSGIAVPYRNFARELRQKAWRKWMGSAVGECAEALDKPALPASWEKIQELAKENAKLYDNVFNFIPKN